jgi:hypothetical protein
LLRKYRCQEKKGSALASPDRAVAGCPQEELQPAQAGGTLQLCSKWRHHLLSKMVAPRPARSLLVVAVFHKIFCDGGVKLVNNRSPVFQLGTNARSTNTGSMNRPAIGRRRSYPDRRGVGL